MAIFVFQAMCNFIPYIELAVTHTSVLTILAITVERYYAICLPLQVLQLLNVQSPRKMFVRGCEIFLPALA